MTKKTQKLWNMKGCSKPKTKRNLGGKSKSAVVAGGKSAEVLAVAVNVVPIADVDQDAIANTIALATVI